jgi:1-acyl-sn-glycerol-3-phosphate acyltransferase
MNLAYHTVTYAIKGLIQVLCRIESDPIDQIPTQGPLILVCNHINFLEVPVMYTRLQPRPIAGFAKSETWDSPFLGALFDLWGGIPLRRGEADTTGFRLGIKALAQGKILAVAPEGTRSGTGVLQRGHPGIVSVALHSGAPLLPLVYYGGETFQQNLRRLRRTDFHIRIGQPFRLAIPDRTVTRGMRREITDEIMFQLAALLPSQYRGTYANLESATRQYLHFI